MSLIDWSDPDEMLGLLIDYVADEAGASGDDGDRAAWLQDLRGELEKIAGDDTDHLARALREMRNEQPDEFAGDVVLTHIDDCIEELRRISEATR